MQLAFEMEPETVPQRPTTPYDCVRYWVEERERIRVKKASGVPPPWTTDPILRTWKFCNVRRRDDRVSQWIRNNIISPYPAGPSLLPFLALARFVNWPPTLAEILATGQTPATNVLDWEAIWRTIDARNQRGEKVETGAYMIRAESDPRKEWYAWPKARYIAEIVLQRPFTKRRQRYEDLVAGNRLQPIHAALVQEYGWASFMAGQVLDDWTWTPLLKDATDHFTWAPPGPGSLRGMNRLLGRGLKDKISEPMWLSTLRTLREDVVALDQGFADLTMMDIQNCLCETDKYLRVKNGEGKPRSEYRTETAY